MRAERDVSPGGSVSKFTAHGSATNLRDMYMSQCSKDSFRSLLPCTCCQEDCTQLIVLSLTGNSRQPLLDVALRGAYLKLCRWGMLAMSRQKGAYSLPLGYCAA